MSQDSATSPFCVSQDSTTSPFSVNGVLANNVLKISDKLVFLTYCLFASHSSNLFVHARLVTRMPLRSLVTECCVCMIPGISSRTTIVQLLRINI